MASRKKQESLPLKGCTVPPTSTEQYLKICKAHPLWRHDSLISSYWWGRGAGWWCGAHGLSAWGLAGPVGLAGSPAVLRGIFGAGWGSAVKLGGGGQMYFCVFFGCYCRSWASGVETGHWAMSPPDVSTQIWDFVNISLFPKVLSLKSFDKSWGNSHPKCAIIDITFRFTCG